MSKDERGFVPPPVGAATGGSWVNAVRWPSTRRPDDVADDHAVAAAENEGMIPRPQRGAEGESPTKEC